MLSEEDWVRMGQIAHEAVHSFGAYRRDFPDEVYYADVAREIWTVTMHSFPRKWTLGVNQEVTS